MAGFVLFSMLSHSFCLARYGQFEWCLPTGRPYMVAGMALLLFMQNHSRFILILKFG